MEQLKEKFKNAMVSLLESGNTTVEVGVGLASIAKNVAIDTFYDEVQNMEEESVFFVTSEHGIEIYVNTHHHYDDLRVYVDNVAVYTFEPEILTLLVGKN